MENQKYYFSESSNGWQTSKTFLQYVDEIVNEMRSSERKITGSIVLIADGFPGHSSYELQKYCNENDVIFIILLPNATHLMQPLDVVVFKPVKTEFKKQSSIYKRTENKIELDETDFIRILSRTLKNAVTADLVKKSFSTTGLFPLNSSFKRHDRILAAAPTQNAVTHAAVSTSSHIDPMQISADIETSQLALNSSAPQDMSLMACFKKLNDECLKNAKGEDFASRMCFQTIETQLNFLQSLHGNSNSMSQASSNFTQQPLPIASAYTTSSTNSSTFDDILKFPEIKTNVRKRQLKRKRFGIISSVAAMNAVEEERQAREAAKEELESRKKARIERKLQVAKEKEELAVINQQKREERIKKSIEKKSTKKVGKAKK